MEKRAIRIAGASGSASDRRQAFATFATNYPTDPIDVLIGDWLSEANMTSLSGKKDAANSADPTGSEPAYEPSFLEALAPALAGIAKHGIKVAVNAGGLDAARLCDDVRNMIDKAGLKGRLNVAWIEGDDVLDVVQAKLQGGKDSEAFQNICTGQMLRDWGFTPIAAQAYLGGMGIAAAFRGGADIVLCGRVSDASPVIGAAAWWHGWGRDKLAELARAFVAGHLVECSTYVTGGNFSGFREMEAGGKWKEIGYPIAEIGSKGEVVITKQKGTGGMVTVDTCKAQLLYEIQGPWYFNSDVTAVLDDIEFEQLGVDRVAVKGVKALPPPPTTKIGITARGGFQAEVHWFLVGLDINEKARMLEMHIRAALAEIGDIKRFHVLEFTRNGSAAENPTNQNAATVDFRVFAQARKAEDIAPAMFVKPIIDLIMCSYPGGTFHLDFRQGLPKPYFEYYVTLLPQEDIKHVVHMPNGKTLAIDPPRVTKTFPAQQPSQSATASPKLAFGETTYGPLGWLVHGRSGDKGSNANVGFWVRHQDEYEWLRSLLSSEKMVDLLAQEYNGKKIDRLEMPNIWAVHFLFHDHLDRGASCSSTYDFLAKNVAEFLRSRYVDLPAKFLNRGRL